LKEIIIYLDPKEAELFKQFLKYHQIWEKIFSISNGSVELHLNSSHEIKKAIYKTEDILPVVKKE
jgi:hypothetical protein